MKRNKPKIKEIYHCEIEENPVFPLQQWYNVVIQKTENELSVLDIMHMFTQKIFLDSAIKKSIDFLSENLFAGELWEGQLIEKLAQADPKIIRRHSNRLVPILKDGFTENELHDWEFEEWRMEYRLAIIELLDICQEDGSTDGF